MPRGNTWMIETLPLQEGKVENPPRTSSKTGCAYARSFPASHNEIDSVSDRGYVNGCRREDLSSNGVMLAHECQEQMFGADPLMVVALCLVPSRYEYVL